MTREQSLPELWIEGACIGHVFEVLRQPGRLFWTIDLLEPYNESVQPLIVWYQQNDCRTIQVKTGEERRDLKAYLVSANWDYFRPIVEIELGLP